MNDRMILVVDDEYELLEMVKSIFERAGFTQVLTASSGEAALKMCKEQMPDMSCQCAFISLPEVTANGLTQGAGSNYTACVFI